MFHQLVSGKPIPLLEASINTALVALRLLFLSSLFSLSLFPSSSSFFFFPPPPSQLGSRDRPRGWTHLCKRDPNSGVEDDQRRRGEGKEESVPLRWEKEQSGSLVAGKSWSNRLEMWRFHIWPCLFSPFVFVRNTAVKRSSAASRNKWHGAPKTGPSPRRGPYLYEISSWRWTKRILPTPVARRGPGFLEFVQVFWDFRAPYREPATQPTSSLSLSLFFRFFFFSFFFDTWEKLVRIYERLLELGLLEQDVFRSAV